MTEDTDNFTRLTWGDLEEWAGAKTLSRGRRYQQEGRVRDLARLPDGDLIAWVAGTERYATTVSADGESIESRCTCPVGVSCKHAVAVVLEYIESVKNDLPIPAAAENDPRLRLIDADFRIASSPDPSLHLYLEELTKSELIDLIETLARLDPRVRSAIADRRSFATAGATPLVEELLAEIDSITDEDPWIEYSSHGIPDYSGVIMKMNALLSRGHFDEIIEIGEVLLRKGTRQIEMVDDEGETTDQITAGMDIVFAALAASSRPAHEKILYAIDAELEDEYGVCEGAGIVLGEDHPGEEWSIAADRLLRRLKGGDRPEAADDYISKYRRRHLVSMAVMALDKASRHDDATDLQVREAMRTGGYPEVVARLLSEGQQDEALQWILKGIAETEEDEPGIADRLRDTLLDIRRKEGDWPAVAAIRAEEFFRKPTHRAFRDLEEASIHAGVRDEVRDAAMHYLITGKRPPAGESVILGVLPDTGIKVQPQPWKTAAPITETLIEIAIAEKNPDEVLRWYDQWEEDGVSRYLEHNLEDRVADAVVGAYPERAFTIWKKRAERLIGEVRPQSYETSLRYLRKLQSHMPPPEWEKYRDELRRTHARKRRFLEVLDRVEDRQIIKDI